MFGPETSADHPTLSLLRAVEPLVAHVVTRLRVGAHEVARLRTPPMFDAHEVPGLFAGGLLGELTRMLTPTLVLRLNVLRLRGELEGDDPAARFRAFAAKLREPGFVLGLLVEYPVLARILLGRAAAWLDSCLSFLRHLSDDGDDLAAAFALGIGLGPLVGVQAQLGDSHHGGRSVLIARFASGTRVVYKPRPLALDLHFQELLTWVNERVERPQFRTLAVLDRGDHGWVEYADHSSCDSEAGVRRFYERQGGHLALLYLLEGTDFHCENLLASGEHPIVVDVEALFHPRFHAGAHHTEDPAAHDLRRSVLRTGLLPGSLRHGGDGEKLDRSGLAAVAGGTTSFGTPQLEALGSDELRLVRGKVPIRPSANVPLLDGQDVGRIHGDAVVYGFEAVYRCVLAHRDELLRGDSPLARFRGDTTRVASSQHADLRPAPDRELPSRRAPRRPRPRPAVRPALGGGTRRPMVGQGHFRRAGRPLERRHTRLHHAGGLPGHRLQHRRADHGIRGGAR